MIKIDKRTPRAISIAQTVKFDLEICIPPEACQNLGLNENLAKKKKKKIVMRVTLFLHAYEERITLRIDREREREKEKINSIELRRHAVAAEY